NKWVNSDMSITDFCGTSQVNPTEKTAFKAWMTGNKLQISGFEGFSEQTHLNLMDLNGRSVFVSRGKLKSKYDLGLITSGLYILEVRDQNTSVSKKLFIQP
ncbi:MAG TPA: T9SS type A sorting domain-containing protein, partial [Saprospiraceae bacterium]|nr:T9SS type A sorting domain-containing protein [Saprospiraceae bacterium]